MRRLGAGTGRRPTTGTPRCPTRPPPTSRHSPRPPSGWGGWTRPSAGTRRPTGVTSSSTTTAVPVVPRSCWRSTPGWSGEAAQSAGWLGRAQRLLDEVDECAEQGYVLYLRIAGHMGGGDLDGALAGARRMQDLGRRFDDPRSSPWASTSRGASAIKQARVPEGLALLDEAMVAALSDELCPVLDGRDLLRADGRVQRAARPAAGVRVDGGDPPLVRPAAAGLALPGHLPGAPRAGAAGARRVGAGRAGGARRLPRTWSASTCSPWPTPTTRWARCAGCAVISPARRRPTRTRTSTGATRSRAWPCCASPRASAGRGRVRSPPRWPRPAAAAGAGGLHAAQVEIALAGGDVALAESAADQVADTAEAFDSDGLRAAVIAARRGRPGPGPGGRRRWACCGWRSTSGRTSTCPYEAARTRMLLAEAYRALDDADAADREAAAAHGVLRRGSACRQPGETSGSGRRCTAREVEVVRLIAAGKSNRGHRHRARSQREDRRPAHVEHLHQARVHLPGRQPPPSPTTTASCWASKYPRADPRGPPRWAWRPMPAPASAVRSYLQSFNHTTKEAEMPKFVIERELPGAGKLSAAELHAISGKSNQVLADMAPPGPVAAELRHRRQDLLRLRRRGREGGPRARRARRVPGRRRQPGQHRDRPDDRRVAVPVGRPAARSGGAPSLGRAAGTGKPYGGRPGLPVRRAVPRQRLPHLTPNRVDCRSAVVPNVRQHAGQESMGRARWGRDAGRRGAR